MQIFPFGYRAYQYIDQELLKDPLPLRGDFVHLDFLKLRYIRNKMMPKHQAPTISSIDKSLGRNHHRV